MKALEQIQADAGYNKGSVVSMPVAEGGGGGGGGYGGATESFKMPSFKDPFKLTDKQRAALLAGKTIQAGDGSIGVAGDNIFKRLELL